MQELYELVHGPVAQPPSPAELNDSILALERQLLAAKEHHIEIPTSHHFAQGVYIREVRIPKGALVVGRRHKTEHLNIVSQGRIAVLTDEGPKIIEAPCTLLSKPGIKRVGYALEDTVWSTVHPTEERDLEKLEAQFIVNEHEQLTIDETRALQHIVSEEALPKCPG